MKAQRLLSNSPRAHNITMEPCCISYPSWHMLAQACRCHSSFVQCRCLITGKHCGMLLRLWRAPEQRARQSPDRPCWLLTSLVAQSTVLSRSSHIHSNMGVRGIATCLGTHTWGHQMLSGTFHCANHAHFKAGNLCRSAAGRTCLPESSARVRPKTAHLHTSSLPGCPWQSWRHAHGVSSAQLHNNQSDSVSTQGAAKQHPTGSN